MPCSSPKHAPLHVRGQFLGPYVLVGRTQLIQGAQVKKARVIKRKKMDMQQN